MGIEGECFTTRTGEPTIRVELASCRFPRRCARCPDKHHGLVDVEARHRQRYLDLIANDKVARDLPDPFSRVLHGIRTFFHERGFLEVETPMMQPVAGGAAAEPFKTHHNALDIDLYLRIAPELYLKRLLVGGYPKVFELNRNFRNEGISRRHNPEFTMLEAYWAYADMGLMADLMEELICTLAERETIEYKEAEGNVTRTINMARPWRRARYRDLIEQAAPGWLALTPDERRARAAARGLEIQPEMADFEVTQLLFEKEVEAKQFDPLFVTHLPKELVPLAKQNAEDPSLVDVFELVVNGMEFAPGLHGIERPRRAARAAVGTIRRRDDGARRGFPPGPRTRHAPGGRDRVGDRPAADAADRLGHHPRRDPFPAFAAQGIAGARERRGAASAL